MSEIDDTPSPTLTDTVRNTRALYIWELETFLRENNNYSAEERLLALLIKLRADKKTFESGYGAHV